jgi:hypothetical protein
VRTGKVDPRGVPEVAQHGSPVFENLAEFVQTL